MSFFIAPHIGVWNWHIVHIHTVIQYDPQNLPYSNICVQFNIKCIFSNLHTLFKKKSSHLRSHASDVTCVLASVTETSSHKSPALSDVLLCYFWWFNFAPLPLAAVIWHGKRNISLTVSWHNWTLWLQRNTCPM